MVADVVNLRRQRKRKDRQSQADAAAENRARFGRPAADRKLEEAETRRARRAHEGHRLKETE